MSISERYRDIVNQARQFLQDMGQAGDGEQSKGGRTVEKATRCLAELEELVGEIPRIRLESELTPVLLRAHGHLDQARVLLEEAGDEDLAARLWEIEQTIYRLLNDL